MDFEVFGDYLAKHNPLAICDEKEKLMHFKCYEDVYLHVLKFVRGYCKRGYVELPLLIKTLTVFDEDTAVEVANMAPKIAKEVADNPFFLNWERVGYSKERFQGIMKLLHTFTETEFDWVAFEVAWLRFSEWLTKHNKDFE